MFKQTLAKEHISARSQIAALSAVRRFKLDFTHDFGDPVLSEAANESNKVGVGARERKCMTASMLPPYFQTR